MKVFVAGGSGFVGRAAVAALVDNPENQVMTLSRSALPILGPNHQHITCDWARVTEEKALLDFAPDVVVNAVGDSHPRNSIGQEEELIATNLLPFFQLLNRMRGLALQRVVFISSAGALYRSALDCRLKAQPDSAYFALKLSTETLLGTWCDTYDIQGLSLRLSNPVGDNNKVGFGVVNHFARMLVNGEEVRFIGDYETFKDYLDVRDAGQAIMRAATHPLSHSGHKVCDLGSGIALTAFGVHAVLQAISQDVPIPKTAVTRSRFDLDDLEKTLNWTPAHSVLDTFRTIYRNAKEN